MSYKTEMITINDNDINTNEIISSNIIHNIKVSDDISCDINLPINKKEELYEEIIKRLSRRPIISHKCHNCGGNIEMDENKHIFICPYCGSTYAVGVHMINDIAVS